MRNQTQFQITVKHIIFGVLGLFALITLWKSFYTVNDGEKALVFTFGEISNVQEAGLNMKMPFVQSALVVDVTQQTDTASNLTAVSADQQQVNTTITVNYRWNNNKLPEIYKNIKLDVSRVLQQRVSEAVKSTTAKYSAYDLIAKREAVREEIQVKLHAELLKYDITLDAMQIVDFRFSKEYEAAIEAKMTADQVAKKAEMDLKRIEVEARQRITQAQAEAEAIRIQAEAVKSQGGAEYVQLKAIEKWNGALPTYMILLLRRLQYLEQR